MDHTRPLCFRETSPLFDLCVSFTPYKIGPSLCHTTSIQCRNRDVNSGSGFRSPVSFQRDRCGCNFAPVSPPTPDPNRIGCGHGFQFSSVGAPETQKMS
jgi:hypothetical protein